MLVVPASLLANWRAEIARFTPSLTFLIVHPSEGEDPGSQLDSTALAEADLVITTYGMLVRLDKLRLREWDLAILDEAQAIKNSETRQTRVVKELKAQGRFALTGTPVENRASDLWSIFDFLNPGLLGSATEFRKFIRAREAAEQVDYTPLRTITRPYILRRLKTDKRVIADLPDKTEVRAWCSLTKTQASLYQQAVASLAEGLENAEGIQRRGLVLSFIMRFKQICNHPSQWLNDGAYARYDYRPYVSVAERLRQGQRELAKLVKKGLVAQPIKIEGRTIASSFWGKAWCDNLESYMDYANRLPRGRTYVRNGSVVHLEVKPGAITALVCGSEVYKVNVQIVAASTSKWKTLCQLCAGGIGSLVELLQGRLSHQVMDIITRKDTGLFPSPREIKMSCSCPDWAGMCKHIAAVLYGVGARLDQNPHLLFVLRSVNHEDLITQASAVTDLATKAAGGVAELAEADISQVFGIELDDRPAPAPDNPPPAPDPITPPPPKRARRPAADKPGKVVPKPRKSQSQRRMSPEARARIAAAQKARWARAKQNKKSGSRPGA